MLETNWIRQPEKQVPIACYSLIWKLECLYTVVVIMIFIKLGKNDLAKTEPSSLPPMPINTVTIGTISSSASPDWSCDFSPPIWTLLCGVGHVEVGYMHPSTRTVAAVSVHITVYFQR